MKTKFENYGQDLFSEFIRNFAILKNEFIITYGEDIEFYNTLNSPNIAVSSNFGAFGVERNDWNVNHNGYVVGRISTMFDRNDKFYQLDSDYNS